MPQVRSRFAALDACRGFCAVGVMLYHLDAKTHWYASPFVRHGYLAVDFFFVLSGFVIASAYGSKLSTPRSFGRFALRRFGRLYPLHAAVLFVYVVVQGAVLAAGQPAFTDNYGLPALLANVFLLQGFGAFHETWNYPAWSISVELWSNLAFGLYVFWLGRRSVWLSALLMLAAGAYAALGHRIHLPVSDSANDAFLDVAQSVFAFLLGTFLFSLHGWLTRLAVRPTSVLQGVAEGVALILIIVVFGQGDAVPEVLVPVAFGYVVLVFAFEAGPISATLRHPLCLALGSISYSVYLTHSVYLMGLESAVTALAQALGQTASISIDGDDVLVLGGPWAMDFAAGLCVGAALLGSALTYRFIEEPARRLFNRLSDGLPLARPLDPTRAPSIPATAAWAADPQGDLP